MIFSEIYSAYYSTVAKILTAALNGADERALRDAVSKHAFSESALTIMPSLKSERWQLLDGELSPIVQNVPTMPLSTLQKRWLRAISDDPRVVLFDVKFPELSDVEPLFTRDDYRVFDIYSDGDPFDDASYIKNFKTVMAAIKKGKAIEAVLKNRKEKDFWVRFRPKGFEYSEKDDKIRIIADGSHFRHFNLGRMECCSFYEGKGAWDFSPSEDEVRDLVLRITDNRNTLERAMLHFAHFEKEAERIDAKHYVLRLKYYASDETEMVIRVLSFGPFIKVTEPQSFVNLIKERLASQKRCEFS